jgi:hypothetical protein
MAPDDLPLHLESLEVLATQQLAVLSGKLSSDRLATFTAASGGDQAAGLRLYVWNATQSAAVWPVLHVHEVVMRNAIAGVLGHVYGDGWPFNRTFLDSLPEKQRQSFIAEREKVSEDIRKKRRGMVTGDIVARQTYQFWVTMLTARYQDRLWKRHLLLGFPNASAGVTRESLWKEADSVRRFRNRVAHHEPLLKEDVPATVTTLNRVIECVCPITAKWVEREWPSASIIVPRPT